MNRSNPTTSENNDSADPGHVSRQQHPSQLPTLLSSVPTADRAALMQSVVSFRPGTSLDAVIDVRTLRAAFANHWTVTVGCPVPAEQLRAILAPPISINTVLKFTSFTLARDEQEICHALDELINHLIKRVDELESPIQRHLFRAQKAAEPSKPHCSQVPGLVRGLNELVDRGLQFPTIYADPPWRYDNESSRAAAVNHYPTMSIAEICDEPIPDLVTENAHLHLWTTNAFLYDAMEVINHWGFTFKSCLVWIKDDIGMGNYWRVSHEFLLLGVRGRLTFQDRTLPSWIKSRRTIHSRKPAVVRASIEKASPPPYLELYGREEFPNSAWTVYGNQVERRLF